MNLTQFMKKINTKSNKIILALIIIAILFLIIF